MPKLSQLQCPISDFQSRTKGPCKYALCCVRDQNASMGRGAFDFDRGVVAFFRLAARALFPGL